MLISKNNRKRLWKRVLVGVIIPSALSYGLAFGQEPTQAPAAQAIPMRPMDEAIPPPPPDGDVAPQTVPTVPEIPAVPGLIGGCGPNRTGCTSDGACGAACAPRAADCQADTIVCTPRTSFTPPGTAAGCGPVGSCRVSDGCNNGLCGPTAGCQAGMACANGCSTNGMPCMAADGSCLSPEVLMGRPYTLGDLKRSIFGAQCRSREILGMDGFSSGSPLHNWWCGQQYKSDCRRAYRNHVLAAHFHNKFNYFVPSGSCGEGAPLWGHYKRVYATEPHYSDPRDSQVYASPMTGHPTAVPLAPTVRHQYNYSWGTPSSRLTPISNIILPRH
ncbi:MAG: hypothetical protein HQ518_06490 [Rhodopirellula sp.]|nr:hypothetical protein [Rhodopirellula sp.]